MTIIDGERYSFENIQDAFRDFRQLLLADGEPYGEQVIYFFNIYLGGRFLNFGDREQKFHICKNMEFGYQYAVFHQVPRSAVLRSENNTLDTCITIFWNASDLALDQVQSGVRLADEIIRNIELATGKAFPIPLGLSQIPTPFEITQFKVGQQTFTKIPTEEDNALLPKVNDSLMQVISALQGFNEAYNDFMKNPPYSLLSIASRWQQKAIRALGSDEWSDCVISSSTWVEVFVVGVTLNINDLIGEPIDDPRVALSRGLPRFITTHLGAKHLKGRWDHNYENTVFGRWYQKCQDVRNEIVHSGKLPDAVDARQAYDAAHHFVKFLTVEIARLEDPRLRDYVNALKPLSEMITGKKPKPPHLS